MERVVPLEPGDHLGGQELDVDLGIDFHPLRNKDWRTLEAVRGHHFQDNAALGMLGFVDRDSRSALVHNRSLRLLYTWLTLPDQHSWISFDGLGNLGK